MITAMIEAYNELRHGKERLRMEIMGLQEYNASYRAMYASAQARADYEKEQYKTLYKIFENQTDQLNGITAQFQRQKAYTMVLVKKLNTIRNLGEYIQSASQLPTEEEMSDDQ